MDDDDNMASINPAQLLSALEPLLHPSGSLKVSSNLTGIIGLMKRARDMVSRCVYINVLQATNEDPVLNKFIEAGGWEVLDDWLQETYSETSDSSFLMELLRIYNTLPVSKDLLRLRATPKTIKKLSRGDSSEEIKVLAGKIVEKWMTLVSGSKPGDSSKDKEKSSKDSHKRKKKPMDTSELPNGKTVKLSSDLPLKKIPKKQTSFEKALDSASSTVKSKSDSSSKQTTPKKSKDSSSSSSTTSSKSSTLSSTNTSSKDLHRQSSSSSVKKDNAVSDSNNSSNKPRTVKTAASKFRSTGLETESVLPPAKKKNISPDKPVKRPSTGGSTQSEKKVKLENRKSESRPASTGSAKAALNVTTKEETHGKIKIIPAKPKPVEIHESTGFMDALTTTIPLPLKIKKKSKPPKITTPTSPTGNKAGSPSSPTSPTGDKPGSEAKEGNLSPTVEDDKTSQDSTSNKGEDDSKSASGESTAAGSKNKKKVHWADERHLRKYFYFELDENERVNVNRVKSFGDIRKQEMMMEGAMLKKTHQVEEKVSKIQIEWRPPPMLTGLPASTVKPGQNSTEIETQRRREETVLQAIFFNKAMVPDSASEADVEEVDYKEPTVIPLEDDSGGPDSVVDHSHIELATAPATTAEEFSLPPDVANMLSQITSQFKPTIEPTGSNNSSIASTLGINLPSQEQLQAVMQSLASNPNGFDKSTPPPGMNEDMMQQFQQMIHQGILPPPPGYPRMGLMPPPGARPPFPPPFPPRPGMMGPFRPGFPDRPPRRPWGRPPNGPRHRPPNICRHFTSGHCQRGNSCSFLHPGINGPPLP